jgi:hypothetical protein
MTKSQSLEVWILDKVLVVVPVDEPIVQGRPERADDNQRQRNGEVPGPTIASEIDSPS